MLKMKKIYCLLSLFVMTSVVAQNKQTEKADNLYQTYQYIDAIDAYLELVENGTANAYIYKQLADSYYHVYNMEEAAKWYEKAVQEPQDAETYYQYAQTLKTQGKYNEANKQMDSFAKLKPNDQRAISHLENPNYIPHLADKSKLFDVESTSINDEKQSDFGSFLSNNNILYFVSSRNSNAKEDSWTHQPYLDIYESIRNSDGSLSEPVPVKELNTPYHDGPITLSADGNTIFFARDGHSSGNSKKLKGKKVKIGQQGIFKATKKDGEWVNVQSLPINSNDYSVSHPSLSPDGKTLYFTSNMPGGLGDTDIWKVTINNGSYGKPENLGENVNSPGKEGFPFISDDQILYFASSGKQGFGGFDIFKIDLSKDEKAVNLGKPVNTKSDDFSFSINTNKNVGYFSSNRTGVDNIYMAVPVCNSEILVVSGDINTNNPLANVSVAIMDSQGNKIETKTTTENGLASFNAECNTNYVLQLEKTGYENLKLPVMGSSKKQVTVNALLKPVEEIITETEVKLNAIYFEFDKSNITEQGATELNRLVEILNNHPDMAILVRSHTDTKGNKEYNQKLSERRAQATVQYLVSKGIAKDRLTAEGVGSSEPKIDCGSNCTQEQDSENRRSEFLIIK